MKIRMKVQLSGTRNGVEWPTVGGTIDVGDEEGAKLCSNGLAEPVAQRGKTQTATAPAAETRGGYAELKQPQLKAELDKRKIDYPKGPVKNEVLVELLEQSDRG